MAPPARPPCTPPAHVAQYHPACPPAHPHHTHAGGLQANLRAFTSALAPVLYAQLYTSGVARRPTPLPGAPYLAAALFTLCAELLHQRLRGATDEKEARPTPAADAAAPSSS